MTSTGKIWVAQEIQELREHLATLLINLADEDYDEVGYRIGIAHALAHLNAAWNARDAEADDLTESNFEIWGRFPTDIEPF